MAVVSPATTGSPKLAEPVVFSDEDAAAFLRELPQALSPETIAALRLDVATAAAAVSRAPANTLFE
jgi:hypothetical protein